MTFRNLTLIALALALCYLLSKSVVYHLVPRGDETDPQQIHETNAVFP